MKSIRRRLTLWLLGGLALLWAAAGAGIYFSARLSLLKSIDAELAVDARMVRFTARGDSSAEESTSRGRGPRLQDRLAAYQDPGGTSFYQTWNSKGEVIERSASLGKNEIASSQGSGSDSTFDSTVLADGRRIRTMTVRVVEAGAKGGGKGKGRPGAASNTIVLAKDLAGVEHTLASLLGGITIIGVLAAGGAVLLVGTALRHGLRPLRVLGEQTRGIDAPSLHARLDAANAPTELQPVYAALNELLHRLEQGFERERRFSADLAHEMRTPVAELKMLSEVALRWPDQAGSSTHEQSLEIAKQLESLIETLLSLARIESGQSQLQITTVDIPSLVHACWQPFAEAAAARNLSVSIEAQAATPMETDARLMRVILSNLITNAVEYTAADGTVNMCIGANEITIANSAPELRQEGVHHLFDRFWRAEKSRSTSDHSGLGLALAQEAAKALGFELTAALRDGLLHFTLKRRAHNLRTNFGRELDAGDSNAATILTESASQRIPA